MDFGWYYCRPADVGDNFGAWYAEVDSVEIVVCAIVAHFFEFVRRRKSGMCFDGLLMMAED